MLANEVGADLVLSLHVDGSPRRGPNGVAAYHFGGGSRPRRSVCGSPSWSSVSSWRAPASLDGRIHGKTWALLRLTRMPAVRVEIGYLTSPVDRPKLLDPLFRDTVAEGLLVAVQRLYLPLSDDPPTGVLRIPAIACPDRAVYRSGMWPGSARHRRRLHEPSSRSSAYSTSSCQDTVVLMSSRRRGVAGAGAPS